MIKIALFIIHPSYLRRKVSYMSFSFLYKFIITKTLERFPVFIRGFPVFPVFRVTVTFVNQKLRIKLATRKLSLG